ncbi:MAG TPA: PTS sugar transporter subunit IIB [Sulfolobales archaeon]|nr:PTS sugar transporter subunit IIB [Sulfolobales archaeon]
MPIRLIRIDDRFIHGQVTVGWVRSYSINEIWIVDDKVAANPAFKELQIALAPPNVNVKILTISEAMNEIKKDQKNNVMIIISSASNCVKLLEGSGLKIDWINVGQSAWKPGRVIVTKSYAVDQEEVEAFKKLREMNIKAIYQMLPEDQPRDFYQLLREKKLL